MKPPSVYRTRYFFRYHTKENTDTYPKVIQPISYPSREETPTPQLDPESVETAIRVFKQVSKVSVATLSEDGGKLQHPL